MTRRGVPKGKPHHFIREWMDYLKLNQAFMIREAGWSKATASQIYNGTQDYSPSVLNSASHVFKVEPYELLMTPERAMAMRRLKESALQIVVETEATRQKTPRKSA